MISPRPADRVRAELAARDDRFTAPGGHPLVQLTGVLRPDGEGTRLVVDRRPVPWVSVLGIVVLALLALVSFSEPAAFYLLLVLVVGLAVASRRLLRVFHASADRALAELAERLDAGIVDPRAT